MFRDIKDTLAPTQVGSPISDVAGLRDVASPPAKILNAMTVDVEDYFHVSAFESRVSKRDWHGFECRVESNVDRILKAFSDKDVKATFFTLGWIAERYPEMVRRMVQEGHELASHGWEHTRVCNHTCEQFADDIARTKHVLEDISGAAVLGYRAANFSIDCSNMWAYDILKDAGYHYSSSIAPINYAYYGVADSPRFAHLRDGEAIVSEPCKTSIMEIPVTTLALPKKNIPCGGGGWFRLYPYQLSKWALQWVNRHDSEACVFYFHPWEIDPQQPRFGNLDLKTRFRHYQNLENMERKLDRLLSDFRWGRMQDVFKFG